MSLVLGPSDEPMLTVRLEVMLMPTACLLEVNPLQPFCEFPPVPEVGKTKPPEG